MAFLLSKNISLCILLFVGILFSYNTCLYWWCSYVNAVEDVSVYMVLAHKSVCVCVCLIVVCNPCGWVDMCEWAVSSVPDLPAVCLNEGLIGLASWIGDLGMNRAWAEPLIAAQMKGTNLRKRDYHWALFSELIRPIWGIRVCACV